MDESSSNKHLSIVQQLLSNDPFSQWMEIEIIEAGDGFCKISCKITGTMLNGYSVTHGGILFSLVDTALAFAAATSGRKSLIVDHSISYTNPAKSDELVIAEATIQNESYKLSAGTVKLINETGRLLALSKGTIYRKSELIEISQSN
ncbi:MAG: PaaI family thioesterase [Balneolaceae bacterium]|nr:PaaI family thioesterase [Balneolaceae bacterium]